MNAETNTITKKEQIVSGLEQLEGLLGVIAVWNKHGFSVLTEGNDLLLVIVLDDGENSVASCHYVHEGVRVLERRLSKALFEKRIFSHDDREVIHWLLEGDIWLDSGRYMSQLQTTLALAPVIVKQQKLLTEFSSFITNYLQCKEFLIEDQILDAYTSVLKAIHHWARIAVIEGGVHPEVTVWKQVRQFNPGIYKLYEELTTSSETLRQRVELVLLGCEFSVMSKMENCCALLVRIVEEAEKPLSVGEILLHPYLEGLPSYNHVPLILNRLSRKSLIREVVTAAETELFALVIKYTGRIC